MTLKDIKVNIHAIRNTIDLVEFKGEKNTNLMYGVFAMIEQTIKDIELLDVSSTREVSDLPKP